MSKNKETSLTIHIIISNNHQSKESQRISVRLNKGHHVKQFNRILKTEGNEKAMVFALRYGQSLDSQKEPNLILTKHSAHWDLIG